MQPSPDTIVIAALKPGSPPPESGETPKNPKHNPTTILNGRGSSSYETPGQLVRIAGWGQRFEGGKEDLNDLQEARVPIVSDAQADKQYNRDDYVPSTQIAASGKGKDTCQGDSGGPLFVYNGSAYVIVGITSGGAKCGGSIPAVYTEVSAPAIYDYIQSQ
jgi:secreted trypsin-like serine protease